MSQKDLKKKLKSKHKKDENEDVVTESPTGGEHHQPADRAERHGKEFRYTAALAKKGVSRESRIYVQAIDEAMTWLRNFRSFYGFVVDEMTVRKSWEIRTAQVEISGGEIIMTMNPDFMALLPITHRAGVIMHECLHIMNAHIPRMRSLMETIKPRLRGYVPIAVDLAVNSLLSGGRELPDFAVTTDKMRIPQPNKDNVIDWPQMPSRRTFEEYMGIFQSLSDTDIKKMMSAMPGGDAPSPDGEDRDNAIDDHEVWSTSEEGVDNEVLTEIIRDKIRAANVKSQAAGVGAGDAQGLIDELLEDKAVNFSAIFQGMIGRHTSTTKRTTMMRPSRRYPVPPGRVQSRKLEIRFYVDVSGSMGDDEVAIGLSEAKHAEDTGQATVTVQQFDWELQGPPTPVAKMGKTNVTVHGRGGTRLAPVIADIDKHCPDLAIISTDGGLEHDIQPNSKVGVIWLLTHNGNPPPWGTVIRLPSKADIERGVKAAKIKSARTMST